MMGTLMAHTMPERGRQMPSQSAILRMRQFSPHLLSGVEVGCEVKNLWDCQIRLGKFISVFHRHQAID